MNTAIAFQLLGGVGLFLYGIKLMGDSLQDLAGDRLRQLIASLTSTPVKGILAGTLVTMVIQSSSATSVMTVSFVHAGLMGLKQAISVMMGAAIGTTITAQLIAFKIKEIALPMIGIGMIFAVFGRSKKQKYIGNGLVGFSLLFLGMMHMEGAMAFLRDRQDIFMVFSSNPFMGVLAGTALTMLVQSSSATVGLTMVMASQGLIDINGAIPILFGDNIGTTITAVIASLGLSRTAKQAAVSQVFFKVIGTIIFMAILPVFKSVVILTSNDISRQLANAHTLFNVTNTLILLPFIDPLARLIEKVVPSKGEVTFTGPQYLDKRLVKASPAAGVEAVRKELIRLGSLVRNMMAYVYDAFETNDHNDIGRVNRTEKMVNETTHTIASYASELFQRSLSEELSVVLSSYVNGLGDIERIGDHAQNLIELFEYKYDHRLSFSKKAMEEFEDMFNTTTRAVDLCLEAIAEENQAKAVEVIDVLETEIDNKEKTLRKSHIKRLNTGKCQPASAVVFIDILSNLERIGDHAHNLSFIVLDVARVHKDQRSGKFMGRKPADKKVFQHSP